eukprot:4277293-Amphidinium_carterae.1
MTAEQWDKKIFDAIDIPQLDTTINADYTEEDDIGKAIIEQFFTKWGSHHNSRPRHNSTSTRT